MKMQHKLLVLLTFLLVAGHTYAYQTRKEAVVFVREYREYGWKEYGSDSVKLAHPVQTLVDFYLVEYRLTSTHLTISKVSASHPAIHSVLVTAALNQAQRQAMQQVLRTTDPILIQQRCSGSPLVVDDGFRLDVTLTKLNTSKTFSWSGNYVRELVEFLNVVNELSPKKYRFYEPGQQEAFKQSLLRASDAP